MNSDRKKILLIVIAVGFVCTRLGQFGPTGEDTGPVVTAQSVLDAQALVLRTRRLLVETEDRIADTAFSLQNALPADPVDAGLLLRKRVCDLCEEAGLDTPQFLTEPTLESVAASDLLTLSFEFSVEGPLKSCLHFLELTESIPEVTSIAFARLSALSLQQGDPLKLQLRLESIVSEFSDEESLLSSYEATRRNRPVNSYHNHLEKLMMPEPRPPVVVRKPPSPPTPPKRNPPPLKKAPPPPSPPAFVLVGTMREKHSGHAVFYDTAKRKSIVVKQGDQLKENNFEAKMLLVKHQSVFLKMRGGTQEIRLSQSLKTIPQKFWLPK